MPHIKLRTTIRVSLVFLCCGVMLAQPPIVLAQQEEENKKNQNRTLESIVENWAFYDPHARCDESRTVSGPAADFLRAQSKLDPRWVDVIVKEADAVGADPIAMASLLFWENRRFPPYEKTEKGSPEVGLGPWQILPGTWKGHAKDLPAGEQAVYPNIYDPAISTKVAARIVKSYGGIAGSPIGSIDQDFSRGKNIPSMATVAKNYNAGQATWRTPASAGWRAGNRTWMEGTRGPWFAQKQLIIDDYILGMTYVYFQIAKKEQVRDFTTNEAYARMALSHQDEMRIFKFQDAGTGGATNPTSTTSESCVGSGGAVAGDIVKTALNYAWNTPNHGPNEENAKEPYRRDMPKINGSVGDLPFSDCGVFVATVIRASGADTKYPKRGTSIQLPYIRSHPEMFEIYDNLNDTADLKPGDILIFASNTGAGHTYVYTGPYKGGNGKNYNSASASWHDHVPEATNAYFDSRGHHFTVARFKTAPAASTTQ